MPAMPLPKGIMAITAMASVVVWLGGCSSASRAPGSSVPTRSAEPTVEVPTTNTRSTETSQRVTVVDLSFGPEGAETDAFLVSPEQGGRGPGILYFHWLETGAPTSNRTEFLQEARSLARSGAVSLLVDGTFPWQEAPSSIDHDVAAIEREVAMLRRALALLAAQPGVDSERLALVGHDFGAMYNSILFAADSSIRGMVMMAPTARWGDWFLRYWAIGDADEDYLAAMAPLDPVTGLSQTAGRPVLLQFGSRDRFIPAEVAEEITQAAGSSANTVTYDADHALDERARTDRVAWLSDVLDIAPPS